MCYYCDTSSDNIECIVEHSVKCHVEHALKVRKRILHHVTGNIVYQSVHFPIELSEIKSKMIEGFQFNINAETQELTWINRQESSSPRKRTHSEMEADTTAATRQSTTESLSTENENENQETSQIFSRVLNMMNDIGRQEDFISVLRGLADGDLDPPQIYHCTCYTIFT